MIYTMWEHHIQIAGQPRSTLMVFFRLSDAEEFARKMKGMGVPVAAIISVPRETLTTTLVGQA